TDICKPFFRSVWPKLVNFAPLWVVTFRPQLIYMNQQNQIAGLCEVSAFIQNFLAKEPADYNETDLDFEAVLRKSENENPWFTQENQRFALKQWSSLL